MHIQTHKLNNINLIWNISKTFEWPCFQLYLFFLSKITYNTCMLWLCLYAPPNVKCLFWLRKTISAARRQNQVFKDSTKYWCDRNKKWKMIPLFWLHWLHAPSLVSIGQSKLKLLIGNWISIFSSSDLDLDHIHLGSNPKLRLNVSYPYTKFGVNRPMQTKVIEQKMNFYF